MYFLIFEIVYNFIEMGLQNALVNAILNPKRSIRILLRITFLLLRAMCNLENYNVRHSKFNIPQPAYYNSLSDIDFGRTFFSLLWVNDLSNRLHEDQVFQQKMSSFDYDAIVKAYFPTKNSALQSINIRRTWKNSYFNPIHSRKQKKQKIQAYRKSDVLFADMMTNTQGIYKLKKVQYNSDKYDKVSAYFNQLLEEYKDLFFYQIGKQYGVIDGLIKQEKLYYLDYPELRENEAKKPEDQRYVNELTSTNGNKYKTYIEIPFAIFAKIKGYLPSDKNQEHLVCLGAVFNDTFNKTSADQIFPSEIYHPFSNDQLDRDRFEMAKSHMACTDTNDFTIRVHLGILHYGSSIYTTAFCNLARKSKELKWFKTQFIDVFSNGLLQIDFMANLTLIDDDAPLAEKIFYLRQKQSIEIIKNTNQQFNIMQFYPQSLLNNGYESNAATISKQYYKKIKIYIDYLFYHHRESLQGRYKEFGRFIYDQLGNKQGRFDGIPISVTEDETEQSLKQIMTNLAYLWVVHHGETFSLVSVANSFYLVPPMMRKPLSQLKSSYVLTDKDKQDWLPPSDVIKDSMTLHKVVTYRDDSDSLLSAWQQIPIKSDDWNNFQKQTKQNQYMITQNNNILNETDTNIIRVKQPLKLSRHEQIAIVQEQPTKFQDFWNDLTLQIYEINYLRNKVDLYNLHWFLPNQLPIALNI